jgi:hypothetical protein
MKKFAVILPVAALLGVGALLTIAASPPQDESKVEKLLKSMNEKLDRLEKRVAELEKKAAEKGPLSGIEERFKGLFDKFKDKGEGMLDELRRAMPDLPNLDGLPDMLQGLDFGSLLETLKDQLQDKMGEKFDGFFDGLDLPQLLDKMEKKSEPRKPTPKHREI